MEERYILIERQDGLTSVPTSPLGNAEPRVLYQVVGRELSAKSGAH